MGVDDTELECSLMCIRSESDRANILPQWSHLRKGGLEVNVGIRDNLLKNYEEVVHSEINCNKADIFLNTTNNQQAMSRHDNHENYMQLTRAYR